MALKWIIRLVSGAGFTLLFNWVWVKIARPLSENAVMGWIDDRYGADRVLSIWAILPAALAVIFSIMYRLDRRRGGYRIERIETQSLV